METGGERFFQQFLTTVCLSAAKINMTTQRSDDCVLDT